MVEGVSDELLKMVIVAKASAVPANNQFSRDNVHGPCSKCGAECVWRPHAPPFPKICLECYRKDVRMPDDLPIVTPSVARDLLPGVEYDTAANVLEDYIARRLDDDD